MALSLVDGMTEEWKPEQYHDTYREDVLALVQKKIKSKQTKSITVAAPEKKEKTSSNVVDLVALLKQSLGGKGKAATADDESGEEDSVEKKPAPRARKPAAKNAAAKPAAKKAAPARRSAA